MRMRQPPTKDMRGDLGMSRQDRRPEKSAYFQLNLRPLFAEKFAWGGLCNAYRNQL